jgi:tetratricopeptide (TPR) repeat protein
MQLKFAGEFALMKEHLDQAFEKSNAPLKWGSMPTELDLYVLLADSASEHRNEAALLEFAPRCEEVSTRNGHKLFEGVAHRAWGVAHTLAKNYGQAKTRLEHSLELVRPLDARWQIGRTLFEFGELYAAQGDFDAARDYFSQALGHFEEMHALPNVERTQARLSLLVQ